MTASPDAVIRKRCQFNANNPGLWSLMTPDDFRALALALPDAVESGHMGKADFRVRKKIYATLGDGIGTLKLDADQQGLMIEVLGDAVYPANGAWGAKGWTQMRLSELDAEAVNPWMRSAWTNVAPKTLVRAQP
ncbi:MAG: MmcQ/YjbR family DNA-binding protein [Pseudomonadota bacterium]